MCWVLGNNIYTGTLPSVKGMICIIHWEENLTLEPRVGKKIFLKYIFLVFGKNFTGDIILFFSPVKEKKETILSP